MINNIDIFDFYKGKKVLLTGHTGFKGSWMTKVLLMAGAHVTGYSLEAPTSPSLYKLLNFDGLTEDDNSSSFTSVIGDIRDLSMLKATFEKAKPEIVIHMAAQPIVRESYIDPVGTYETNVLGTVNLLECCRTTDSVKSVINVTTDKVYRNVERQEGYREDEELCGYDPYSNSKSCSELVSDSYRNAFLNDLDIRLSTMRAGNVIGGGDFAKDRIIPDCVRACESKSDIVIRNPYSTRPYQHVLEPVVCYLKMAALQYMNGDVSGAYNIGPDDTDAVTTGKIADMFCEKWNASGSEHRVKWINKSDGGPHEANFLKLDCTKLKTKLGWSPKWNIDMAMDRVVSWYSEYVDGADIEEITKAQIMEYLA